MVQFLVQRDSVCVDSLECFKLLQDSSFVPKWICVEVLPIALADLIFGTPGFYFKHDFSPPLFTSWGARINLA